MTRDRPDAVAGVAVPEPEAGVDGPAAVAAGRERFDGPVVDLGPLLAAAAAVAPGVAEPGWSLTKARASVPPTSCVRVVMPIGVVTVMVLLAPPDLSLPPEDETTQSMR